MTFGNNMGGMFGGPGGFGGGFSDRILSPICSVDTQARTPHNHNYCIMNWREDEIKSPVNLALHKSLNATMKMEDGQMKPKVSMEEGLPFLKDMFTDLMSEGKSLFEDLTKNTGSNSGPFPYENKNETKRDDWSKWENFVKDSKENAKEGVNPFTGGPVNPTKDSFENNVRVKVAEDFKKGSDNSFESEEFNAEAMKRVTEESKPKVSEEVMSIIKEAASRGESSVSIINTVCTGRDAIMLDNLGFKIEQVNSNSWPDTVSFKISW